MAGSSGGGGGTTTGVVVARLGMTHALLGLAACCQSQQALEFLQPLALRSNRHTVRKCTTAGRPAAPAALLGTPPA